MADDILGEARFDNGLRYQLCKLPPKSSICLARAGDRAAEGRLPRWRRRQQAHGHLHGSSVTTVVHLNGYPARAPGVVPIGCDLHIVNPWMVMGAFEHGAIRIWIDRGHGLPNSPTDSEAGWIRALRNKPSRARVQDIDADA